MGVVQHPTEAEKIKSTLTFEGLWGPGGNAGKAESPKKLFKNGKRRSTGTRE